MIAPPPQDAAHALFTQLHQHWKDGWDWALSLLLNICPAMEHFLATNSKIYIPVVDTVTSFQYLIFGLQLGLIGSEVHQ